MRATFLIALLAAGLLAGCATPIYQTKVQLIPPTDTAGRNCVGDCEARKTSCQTDCRVRYESCAKGVEPQVEARYIEALGQYEVDLRRYAAALRHYEMELHFGWVHGYPYAYPWGWGGWGWYPWPGPMFPPPYPQPVMPTRDSVRAHLIDTTCQDDCGCLPAFDACYVGCGGKILRETVCVKNCPPLQ
jgi:hypothetical protein